MEFFINSKGSMKREEISLNLKKSLAISVSKSGSSGERSSSPEEKCPICLVVPIDNKSFANRCFHSFCKFCIIEWSKVRMECPLCRTPFDSLIVDVKSISEFKELTLADLIKVRFASTSRSSTHHHISPFLSQIWSLGFSNALTSSSILASQIASRQMQPGTLEHRRYIYAQDLYVLPCGNGITSRRRDATAHFFLYNPACLHRLYSFLNLELRALIHDSNDRDLLMTLIKNALIRHNINNTRFQREISQFTVHRTVHFIHEFYNFAISTFDSVTSYYQNAVYVPRNQTTVVRIHHTDESNQFDPTSPYNYRVTRGSMFANGTNESSITNETTRLSDANLSSQRSRRLSTSYLTESDYNVQFPTRSRPVLETFEDADSDVELLSDNQIVSRTQQQHRSCATRKSTNTNDHIDLETTQEVNRNENPQPSTSGQSNNSQTTERIQRPLDRKGLVLNEQNIDHFSTVSESKSVASLDDADSDIELLSDHETSSNNLSKHDIVPMKKSPNVNSRSEEHSIDDPQPSTSGLSNACLEHASEQRQPFDDSDSDYDDDNVKRKPDLSSLFCHFEDTNDSDNTAIAHNSSAKRDLDDDSNHSIEYVGIIRPAKRRRISAPIDSSINYELIELTDDDDTEHLSNESNTYKSSNQEDVDASDKAQM